MFYLGNTTPAPRAQHRVLPLTVALAQCLGALWLGQGRQARGGHGAVASARLWLAPLWAQKSEEQQAPELAELRFEFRRKATSTQRNRAVALRAGREGCVYMGSKHPVHTTALTSRGPDALPTHHGCSGTATCPTSKELETMPAVTSCPPLPLSWCFRSPFYEHYSTNPPRSSRAQGSGVISVL